jgi:polyisoprenoid-binding protein YceI
MKIASILALFLFAVNVSLAQTFTVHSKTEASVVGTSSLHDWESEVENVSGSGDFTLENGEVKEIKNLNIVFKSKSIESGKSKMNSITYDALMADKFPNITFKLNSVEKISGNQITASGNLTIAKQTKPVTVKGVVQVEGNAITITGNKQIDMTQFGIEPPTAMFGTIKVGKDVNVLYTIQLTN